MIDQIAPAILELLADDVPRSKAAIVAALAGRHDAEDVALALVRLAVVGQVEQIGGNYTPAQKQVPDVDRAGPEKATCSCYPATRASP